MDLKDFFRATDGLSDIERHRAYRSTRAWQWRTLMHYPKPTVAMVNGWCFGGAFTPLICCDLAIADQDAVFGLSEINWGVIPGGVVSKAIATVMGDRKALYYVMTGEQFNGAKAAELGLVNEAVHASQLRQRTTEHARSLLKKNPTVLRQERMAYKYAREMSWEQAAEYLTAKVDQTNFVDPEKGKEQGLQQFLDQKSFRPGHGSYER
jgi:trans-feruloyl-CoA hydratase/vanillin synthase